MPTPRASLMAIATLGCLPLQGGRHLDRLDHPAEDAGENVADAVFEHALDALNQAFLVSHDTALP